MFLPVGDAPNPPFTPWVNRALIALNVAAFIFLLPRAWQRADPSSPSTRAYLEAIVEESPQAARDLRAVLQRLSRYDVFVFEHGFRPKEPRADEVLWSMFLHGGLGHLLGNMLFLWIFGDNVEHRLGRFRYLAFYLGTGAAAAAGDALLRLGSGIPAVGASGAISGVLGAYFLWFPRNRVRTWVVLFPFWWDVVEIRARWVLGFYVVFQNLLPVLLAGGRGGGVSYGAHLGGFVAGLGVAWGLDRLVLERPERDLFEDAPRGGQADADLEGYRAALAGRRVHEAAGHLFRLPRSLVRRATRPDELVWIGRRLEEDGHGRGALAAYELVLREHPVGPGTAAAHLGCARVLLDGFALPTEAYQHLRAAFDTAERADEVAEARALWEELTRRSVQLPRRPF
jgi:membrane associated rhomboid family serine protease